MKRTTILIIGHNQSMNFLLHTVLSKLYHLVIVNDVFHGMHELKNQQGIGLIIIDIDFQTKESIDFILHINSSKLYNRPLIVLSSDPIQKKNESVIESNVFDYFIKPFNPIDLINSINEVALSETFS